uniref:Pentatricopeptide repeat-containing protein At4g30825, chloroplastic n=1 Tax=Elaeis guineensis var. tenera TaxID=51953 RepID=A0A6I9Q863_ELAGV|nr:pentatricopeptide repeat-containing protein At4g30825, chloroplastic [Elaeis guineensis]
MDSLKSCAVPEIYESKRCNFWRNSYLYGVDCIGLNSSVSHISIRFAGDRKKIVKGDVRCYGFCVDCRVDKCSSSSFPETQFASVGGSRRWDHNPKIRLQHIVVRGLEGIGGPRSASEFVKNPQSSQAGDAAFLDVSLTPKNPVPNLMEVPNKALKDGAERKSGRKIWNRFLGIKKAAQRKVSRPVFTRKGQILEHVKNYRKLEVALSAIESNSSMEQCNFVLRMLEKNSDEKTMTFFKWMRSNGKLKKNTNAYQLALRALARKEDWCRAKMLIQEMTSVADCELSARAFNVLIYVCAKRGLVGWGTKWFHMMLERGVQPDIATFGMLMSLYQKSGKLSEAEFTFGHMRSCKIHCISAYSSMITIYTRLGMYDKSEEIISLMEKDEVLPNLENWLVRINAYSQQGKLEEAESVLKSMLDAGISPNIVAYNTLITGYGKVSNPKAAKRLFQTLESDGLEPDETTYRSMVEGFGRTDNYREALWYYEELKSSGFRPTSSNFYTMINLQARHCDEKGVVQTLKDMRLMGCQYSSIVSSLLQAYERVGRTEKVPHILNASFYENILLDPTSCSVLVMAYIQNSLLDDALQVLQDKRWEDSEFEDNLYHLLICSCKEVGHYENAVKIYTQMPKSEAHPNLHIACSMINIFSALDRFPDAEKLYLRLKASGITFDMVAYSIVVQMYIKAGSIKDACLVLDMMEMQKDIIPDTFLFRDMLRTYQQCGMLEKLANTYYWILKSGATWDEAMYNCVINCCGHALPVDELSRLFDEMIRCGYAANTITFNVMLDVCGKAGLFKKATKIFWMACKRDLADIISYNTIISAYGQIRDFRSMHSVVQRMQCAGHPVSLEAYNCMLDAYGKEDRLEEFNTVLQKMKEASCVSDHYTYNIMINIYGKKGWIEEVARVLAELKERGLEPDLYGYNTLIKAYGIAGMVEEAANVVQEMRAKGINPDRVTFVNLINALQRNEKFLEAVKWSLWMKQMGMSN